MLSSMLENMRVSVGLYRHFKGEYYYVTGLSKSATDEKTVLVNYFNICHPEYGSFSRPLDDFCSDYDVKDTSIIYIVDRIDNRTGQHLRFERVRDLNFQLGSVSTEQLIDELRRRTDSPIHELDIEELQSNIYCKDYVVGMPYDNDYGKGVDSIVSCFKLEDALKYASNHQLRKGTRIYKRTFIIEE